MEFGAVPLERALGGILAHSEPLGRGAKLRKGVVLAPGDIAKLKAAGLTEVVVARLGPGDCDENQAATELAAALVPDPASANIRIARATTGRVNLYASKPGVVVLDSAAIHAVNRVDPMITFATPRPFRRVDQDALIGTIKIISYGVARADLERAKTAAQGAIRLQPAGRRTASLILSQVPGAPQDPAGKGPRAVGDRLRALGATLTDTVVVGHDEGELARAMAQAKGEVILILTASATSDIRDTAPAALRQAGGEITRFGMPVDPGNLLFLGALGARPVIGLPGCARSPALNGADWVIERVICGIDLTDDEITAMGLGGLLKESPARPHPRETGQSVARQGRATNPPR